MNSAININQDLRPTFKKILHFLFSKQKLGVISIMLAAIITGVTPAIDSIFLQQLTNLIESIQFDSHQESYKEIIKWSCIYCIWWGVISIVHRVFEYVYLRTVPLIKIQVIDELYEHVQYHSNSFFQNNFVGDITSRITEAAHSIDQILLYLNDKIIRKFSVLIFALIALYSVHKEIAYIFFSWLVLFLGTSAFFAKKINKFSILYARSKTVIAGKIVDSIANIFVIRMFTSHLFERDYLHTYLAKYVKSDQEMQWFMLKLRLFLGASCAIMIFFVIYYLLHLKLNGVISTGDCILVVTLFTSVVDDVWDLTVEFGEFFEHLGSFSQTMSLLESHNIQDSKGSKDLKILDARIEFKNVTFNYHRNNNIFYNKSIIIPAKQKVGLVGYSGSGKTTFASLIARLHDIESGQILIDNQDIAKITQESLRKNITLIPQEPILFNRTIMENIRYSKQEATDDEVIEAAKNAHIHAFILSLPKGYNSLCGERGNNLSGGQRQRVIIARAILKNTSILILDEATSSLDTNTETLIQQSLHTLMQGKTVIIIAHRLSTLVNMDRILVFNNGHIVEDGDHHSLKNAGGIYQKLWTNSLV